MSNIGRSAGGPKKDGDRLGGGREEGDEIDELLAIPYYLGELREKGVGGGGGGRGS